MLLLAFLLLAVPAEAQVEAPTTESLVRRADAVAEAQVVVRGGREGGRPLRFPVLEILDVLEGEPPDEVPLVLTDSFEPPVGEPAVWFLARGSRGWVPLGPAPFRPLEEADRVRALLTVRRDPRRYLEAEPRLLGAALDLLQPRPEDRIRLVGLLGHGEAPIRLRAAAALGRLDRNAALRWLFARWPVDDPARFLEVRAVVASLLHLEIPVPLDNPADRRRAVELYRLAWELSSQDRGRALQRLPVLRKAVAVEEGPWALEALALYPPEVALPGLADALRNPDEAVLGRALALLREDLRRPEPALRKALAGPAGSLLRNRLQALGRRTWSEPAVGRMVAADARDLLGRVRDLAGQDPSSAVP